MGFLSDGFDSIVDFFITILEYVTRLGCWWAGLIIGCYAALWAALWRVPTDLWHTFKHIIGILKTNSPWALHDPSRYYPTMTNGPTGKKFTPAPVVKKKPAVPPEFSMPVSNDPGLISAKVA
jgi:hypothetical protein